MARERNCDKKELYFFYSGHKSNKNEFGTGFCISRHIMDNFSYSEPVKDINKTSGNL